MTELKPKDKLSNRRDLMKRAGILTGAVALGAAFNHNQPDKYPRDEWPEGYGPRGKGPELLGSPSEAELRLALEQFIPEAVKLIQERTTALAKDEIGPIVGDPEHLKETLEAMMVSDQVSGNIFYAGYGDTENNVLSLGMNGLLDKAGKALSLSGTFGIAGLRDSELDTGARTPEMLGISFGYQNEVPRNIISFNSPDYDNPGIQLGRGVEERFNLPDSSEPLEYRQFANPIDDPNETLYTELQVRGELASGASYDVQNILAIPSNPEEPAISYYLYSEKFPR